MLLCKLLLRLRVSLCNGGVAGPCRGSKEEQGQLFSPEIFGRRKIARQSCCCWKTFVNKCKIWS